MILAITVKPLASAVGAPYLDVISSHASRR